MKFKPTLILLVLITMTSCNSNTSEATNGLIKKESKNDFETTYNKVKSILEANPNLKILLELDHSANAASVDLDLSETKIILFGNPKLGTPLMQNSQTVSIDLPQKIIVYKDKNNKVNVAFNDPAYLVQRHNMVGNDAILQKITKALHTITDKAIEKG